ncbi:hypothetical protein DFH28DRAFT_34446 [Melampsora americana]|nr:hypothetical protein DFH28DRAFT_34446 [Melampsora americana]
MKVKSLGILAPCAILILCELFGWSHSHPTPTLEGHAGELLGGNLKNDKISDSSFVIPDVNSAHKADSSTKIRESVESERSQKAANTGEDIKSLTGDVEDARISQTNKASQSKTPTQEDKKTFLQKIKSFFLDGPVKFWKKIKQWFSKTNIFKSKSFTSDPKEESLSEMSPKDKGSSKMHPKEDKASVGIEKKKEETSQQEKKEPILSNKKEAEETNSKQNTLTSIPSPLKETQVVKPSKVSRLVLLDEKAEDYIKSMEDIINKHIPNSGEAKEFTLEQKKPNPPILREPISLLMSSNEEYTKFLEDSIRSVRDVMSRYSTYSEIGNKALTKGKIQKPRLSWQAPDALTSPLKDSEITEEVEPLKASSLLLLDEEVKLLKEGRTILENAVRRYLGSLDSLEKVLLEIKQNNSSLKDRPFHELWTIRETVNEAFENCSKSSATQDL